MKFEVVIANKTRTVELERDARDVVVANPLIADAVVKTPRRIFLMALKVGQMARDTEVFTYFKHEETAEGAMYAESLLASASSS